MFSESTAGLNARSKQWQALESKRQQAQATVAETNGEWQQLHLRVHMLTACAVVNLQLLPDKLNPVVRPLMEAVKREENTLVQAYAASFVAKLLQQCCARSPCPNAKIVKNLCASACADSSTTPSSACPVPPTQEALKGLFANTLTWVLPVSKGRLVDLFVFLFSQRCQAVARKKTGRITWSTKHAGSSLSTATRRPPSPSPARGARPLRPRSPPTQTFPLAASWAPTATRCERAPTLAGVSPRFR